MPNVTGPLVEPRLESAGRSRATQRRWLSSAVGRAAYCLSPAQPEAEVKHVILSYTGGLSSLFHGFER